MVFTKGLSRTMETSSVSYDTFKAITLQNNTITGIVLLIKDFLKTSNKRGQVAIAWTIFAGSFVLLIPTWMSAMTGYTADTQPFVSDKVGRWLPYEGFEPVIYIIHDGARLGREFLNDTKITTAWRSYTPELDPGNLYDCLTYEASWDDGNIVFQEETLSSSCKWLWAVSKYVSDYGFLPNDTALNTTFHQPRINSAVTTPVLLSPSLNISAYFAIDPNIWYDDDYPWNGRPYGRQWQNPINDEYTFNYSNPMFWEPDSQTLYDISGFNSAGRCQQAGRVEYKWGFSFLLLYAFVLTLLVWTLGMWIFYLDSWLQSRLSGQMGPERAVLDISRSIPSDVDVDHVQLHSNSMLQPLFRENQLTYSDLPLDVLTVTRWTKCKSWWRDFDLREWLKEEKWWLCAMLFFDIMFALSWITRLGSGWIPYIAMLPGFGVFLVLAVGSKARGRWTLFAFWFLLFWIPNCWWISENVQYY